MRRTPTTTVGHILTLHFHDFWKCVSYSCDLYHVELCDALLCWLSKKGNFEIDSIIKNYEVIKQDVTTNFEKFNAQSNPRRKGNITIRVPSHCLVKYLGSKTKSTQEQILIYLLASIYLHEGNETFKETVQYIKSCILLEWLVYKYRYAEFLKALPNYETTRKNRR